MVLKKLLSVTLVIILIFSLNACKKDSESNKEKETLQEFTTSQPEENIKEVLTDEVQINPQSETVVTTTVADKPNEEKTAKSDEATLKSTETTKNKQVSASPSDWTKKQIANAYKKAAAKSHSTAISSQTITTKNISVNNGDAQWLFDDIVTPVMTKLLANNSTDKKGITGGYNNLKESDIASAKAYKSGKNTVIEMTMVEQTSGAKEDPNSGTVGHAITAVGDISSVIKQLEDLKLPLQVPEKNTKIYYTDPKVKIIIGEDGKIINGTWCYTVEIRLNDYKAFGKDVSTTSVILNNTITVNGGFKK